MVLFNVIKTDVLPIKVIMASCYVRRTVSFESAVLSFSNNAVSEQRATPLYWQMYVKIIQWSCWSSIVQKTGRS